MRLSGYIPIFLSYYPILHNHTKLYDRMSLSLKMQIKWDKSTILFYFIPQWGNKSTQVLCKWLTMKHLINFCNIIKLNCFCCNLILSHAKENKYFNFWLNVWHTSTTIIITRIKINFSQIFSIKHFIRRYSYFWLFKA